MKYFESDSDFTSSSINSPFDLLRFIITCVFLSPIRLILEVSKKIMFTGEYFRKFILNCIYINIGLIVMSLLSSLFITKRFYLYGNLIPISSLLVSLLIILAFDWFEKNHFLHVDFESKESVGDSLKNISDVYGVDLDDKDLEDVDSNISSPSMDGVNNSLSIDDEEEIEINDDDDFDRVYDNVVETVMPTVDANKRSEIAARLEAQKAQIKETTQLHEPSTNVKQEFINVLDQEKSKVDSIKENSMNSDTDAINARINSLAGMLRGSSNLKVDPIESDDSIVNDAVNTLQEYNKRINNRATKKSMSIEELMMNNNSAVMKEVDEEEFETPSEVDITVNGFNNRLSEAISASNSGDHSSPSIEDYSGFGDGSYMGDDLYYTGGIMEETNDFDPSFMM